MPINVAVDAVVHHTAAGNHQRQPDHGGQQQSKIDLPLGSEEVSPRHRNQVAKDDAGLGDQQVAFEFHWNIQGIISMSALTMIQMASPTSMTMISAVNRKATRFQRPSDEVFMCRKHTRCTTT